MSSFVMIMVVVVVVVIVVTVVSVGRHGHTHLAFSLVSSLFVVGKERDRGGVSARSLGIAAYSRPA